MGRFLRKYTTKQVRKVRFWAWNKISLIKIFINTNLALMRYSHFTTRIGLKSRIVYQKPDDKELHQCYLRLVE